MEHLNMQITHAALNGTSWYKLLGLLTFKGESVAFVYCDL